MESEEDLTLQFQNDMGLLKYLDIQEIYQIIGKYSKEFNVKFRNDQGDGLLHYALVNHQFEMAKYLIDAGCDIRAEDYCGSAHFVPKHECFAPSPFDLRYYSLSTLIRLLNLFPSPRELCSLKIKLIDILDTFGRELFYLKEYKTSEKDVKAEEYAELFEKLSRKLSIASIVYLDDTNLVRYAVEKGADVNARSASGLGSTTTALHIAVENASTEQMKILLEAGADPCAVNESNELPLHHAAASGADCALGMVRLLLLYGSTVNGQDDHRRIPLHYAVKGSAPDTPGMVKLLLEYGSTAGHQDKRKALPLLFAVESNETWALEVVRLLLEFGSPINSAVFRKAMGAHKRRVMNTLAAALAKFQFLGQGFGDVDKNLIAKNTYFRQKFKSCVEEIERMRMCHVTGNIYLVDLLVKRLDGIVPYTRNEEFGTKFVESDEIYKNEFPNYCELLKSRYLLAEERRIQLDNASDVLWKILPFSCARHDIVRNVLNYLRPEDLVSLINAAS